MRQHRAVAALVLSVSLTLTLAGCEAGGSSVPQDTARASTQAAVTVPDLTGLRAAEVAPALAAAGLYLGPTTYQPSEQPVDIVVSQEPSGGSAVQRGLKILVVLSSGPGTTTTPTPSPSSQPTTQPAADSAAAALGTLRVAGRGPKTGYAREQFGQAWYDVDGNGCDTRNDILTRDLTGRTYRASSSCAVAAGTLADPYTANTIRFVRGGGSEVDIDHVVALSNAWVTGAPKLSYSKRVAFANDPLNLLAVDASANRQKGDGDAATWLPSNSTFRCAYVARQVGVKVKYGLYVTPAEKAAMQQVLSACPNQKVLKGGGATESGLTKPAPSKEPTPASLEDDTTVPGVAGGTDRDYGTCKAAKAAGKGPYYQGQDPEYDFYRDGDSDGIVCE